MVSVSSGLAGDPDWKQMTLQRHRTTSFGADPHRVAAGVRKVLARRPPYRGTLEVEPDALFSTRVRPYWFLASTEMTVRLDGQAGGTAVLVATRSQWYVRGDVFRFYDRYISAFLTALEEQLAASDSQAVGAAEQGDEADEAW